MPNLKYVVSNPNYHNALKRGASVRWLKKETCLHPKGFLPPAELKEVEKVGDTTVSLYPKQKEVFDAIKNKSSSLVYAKTAFGKSVLITALAQVWGGRTLILSHSKENVLYLKEQVETFAGLPCGVFYSDKKDIKDITVTTFHSFRANQFPLFDNLIIDEADSFFSDKSREVICKHAAKRKIGLSGTIRVPHDIDKEPHVLELFYGHIHIVPDNIEDTPLEDVYCREYKKQYVRDIKTNDGSTTSVLLRANNWKLFREFLDVDRERKIAQLEYIQEKSNGFALVLFDRVADVDVFYRSATNRDIKCYKSYGSQPTKERTKHMKEFKDNESGIMFAQYKTVGRGWDFPALDKVFIFFPMKNETNIRQIFGRVIRIFRDKKSYVYLWADSSLYFQLKNQKKVIKEFFNKTIKDV